MTAAIAWVAYCWGILMTCTLSAICLLGLCYVWCGLRDVFKRPKTWQQCQRDRDRREIDRLIRESRRVG